jgi:radical SAM protein with 4Fe4S-binding SPASM domain
MMDNVNSELAFIKLLLNSDKCSNLLEIAKKNVEYDPNYPVSIELHLTNRCNLRCEWCVDHGIRHDKEDIPRSSLIQLLEDLSGYQIGITVEGGGEPTLHPDFEYFIEEGAERGFKIGLITNGVNRIDKNVLKKLSWIRVSLDAATTEEFRREKGVDQFDRVMANIDEIGRNSGEAFFGLSYVLNNRNCANLLSLLKELDKPGINYIKFRNVEENDHLAVSKEFIQGLEERISRDFRSRNNLRVLFQKNTGGIPKDNNLLPCIAHSLRSIIHANGDVVLCEKRRHDPIILGNINRESYHSIWNSLKRLEVSKRLLEKNNQIGCAACRITSFNELLYSLTQIKTANFI